MPDPSDDDARRAWRGVAPDEPAGQRLDQLLAHLVPELSRAQAQRLIREGRCLVDGARPKPSDRVAAGARITLEIVEPRSSIPPEFTPLDVLHEDRWLVALNKPPGMVVHPARGAPAGTLLNALAGHVGPGVRPTFIHRLDRHTSGVILAAKTVQAHRALKDLMVSGGLQRTYWAAVWGLPAPAEGIIDAPIARDRGDKTRMVISERGARAVSHYRVLESHRCERDAMALVEVRLETGRTHQIRAHFEWIGHPLLGDRVYRGARKALLDIEQTLPGQALHSRRIEFDHPSTRARTSIEAPLPHTLEQLLQSLRGR